MAPHEVALWQADDHPQAASRRDLMRQAFSSRRIDSPLASLGRTNPDLGRDALNGMSLVECRSRGQEAALIAVAMREVLEIPERTAALVTPDRQLAEAVIAALRRWDIDIDDLRGSTAGAMPGRWLPASSCAALRRGLCTNGHAGFPETSSCRGRHAAS